MIACNLDTAAGVSTGEFSRFLAEEAFTLKQQRKWGRQLEVSCGPAVGWPRTDTLPARRPRSAAGRQEQPV